jgi:hypothetical protein
MNGWIDQIWTNNQYRIATFGSGAIYYVQAPCDTTFTLGMNVTFAPSANPGGFATDVAWDGTYSKPGANGLFDGVEI